MKRSEQIRLDGHDLTITNAPKIYFPDNGFTKGQVIQFYSTIAPVILPHLHDRPLTLKRYPEGVAGEHFYEKNAPSHTPPWVKRFAVPRSEGGSKIHYVLCNDRATLIWATNLGDIEKHVLLGRVPELNHPTAIVFDLDPGEPAGIVECGEVALELRKVFAALNLECFVKVSGSKGLHLSVPLHSGQPYEVVQPFAQTIAELMVQKMPDRVVSQMAKSLRRGKILIDWSQNSDFKTTVAAYAMRAKRGEPFISMPVTWAELAKAVKRGDEKALFFTPDQAVKRIQRLGDLHAPVLELRQSLPESFTQAIKAGPKRKLASWPRNPKNPKDRSLREYAAKRDHTQTPEPPAKPTPPKPASKRVHRFVIQKHAATHLHYDWRLEMEGVLRSWAVPKGPPTAPKEARLAMHVEDHPIEYADFEGTIPPGNYGAGTVMVWDQGEYEDLTGNPSAAFHQGKMHLKMRGRKLKGEWILVKDRHERDSNKWLLIKAGTAIHITAKADDTSAVSGRSMQQIARDADRQWQSHRKAAQPAAPRRTSRKPAPTTTHSLPPAYVEPMQCKPVTGLPAEANWTFEIKFDGYRCIAVRSAGKVDLYSRNKKKFNTKFPEVADAVAALPGEFALDGEIVAFDAEGGHSFQRLQNSASERGSIVFYCFDLLNLDGSDLTNLPIERRRVLLAELLTDAHPVVRPSPLLSASPGEIIEAVTKLGLEGVVGKRNGSAYEPGKRSGAWIKHRTNQSQEFVIGGYVPGTRGFDSILVGVYEKSQLLYVAKVRNGFVDRVRKEVFAAIAPLQTAACPFANLPEKKASRWGESLTAEKMKECRWVKPLRVCQVAFLEWTEGGKLRHCTFLGMREDKKPKTVSREI